MHPPSSLLDSAPTRLTAPKRPPQGKRSLSTSKLPSSKHTQWAGVSSERRGVRTRSRSASHFNIRQISTVPRKQAMGELINSLPPEILGEIFSWCAPTFADHDAPHQSPLLLSHVCQRWRNVALSTPCLWTYAKIAVRGDQLDPPIELMQLWLEHAKAQSLFIDVDFGCETISHSCGLHLFDALISVGRRYRPALSPVDEKLKTHIEIVSEVSPDSEVLEERYFWSIGGEATTLLPAAGAQLRLRASRKTLAPFEVESYMSLSASLTFLNIKVYDGSLFLTVEDCAMILSSFPQLVHCALYVDHAAMSYTDTIELKNLTTFELSWSELVDVGPLFDCLVAPALKDLNLSGILPEAITGHWDHLFDFLERSRPPLDQLTMWALDCYYIRFLDCLALCPALVGLWMMDCTLDDGIIAGLCRGIGSADARVVRASALATLADIALFACHNFTLDCLVAGLRDAKDACGALQLETLMIRDCGHIREDHLPALRALDIPVVEVTPLPFDDYVMVDEMVSPALT